MFWKIRPQYSHPVQIIAKQISTKAIGHRQEKKSRHSHTANRPHLNKGLILSLNTYYVGVLWTLWCCLVVGTHFPHRNKSLHFTTNWAHPSSPSPPAATTFFCIHRLVEPLLALVPNAIVQPTTLRLPLGRPPHHTAPPLRHSIYRAKAPPSSVTYFRRQSIEINLAIAGWPTAMDAEWVATVAVGRWRPLWDSNCSSSSSSVAIEVAAAFATAAQRSGYVYRHVCVCQPLDVIKWNRSCACCQMNWTGLGKDNW